MRGRASLSPPWIYQWKICKNKQYTGHWSSFSQTHKVGININANFVFPYICSFLHYLYLKMLVNVKSDISVSKVGLPFKVTDFIGCFNFEWHGLNEVGNIAILVLWRDHEKLWWQGRIAGREGGGAPTYNLANICLKKKKSVTKRKILITWIFFTILSYFNWWVSKGIAEV